MSEVSFYKKMTDNSSVGEVEIKHIMKAIKDGKWKEEVDKYRASGDPVDKLALPAFTGSGTFSTRNADSMLQHSGFIIIDIDKQKDAANVRKILTSDRFTKYCFISCGGEGVAVVVAVDPLKHHESFMKIQEYYMSEYGLKIDKACKDVSRLRFVSADSEMTEGIGEQFKLNVVNTIKIFDIVSTQIVNAPEGEKHHTLVKWAYTLGGYVAGNVISHTDAESCLKTSIRATDAKNLVGADKTIADGLKEGASKPLYSNEVYQVQADTNHAHQASRKAYGVAMKINESGVKYTDQTIIETCEELLINKAKCEQVFKSVSIKHKDAFGINSKPEIDQLEYFIKSRYEIRKNEVLQLIECKINGRWESVNVDEIYRDCQKSYNKSVKKFSLEKIKSLVRSKFIKSYNPFETYFNRLADWDKEIDYIDQLADYITVTDQSFYKTQFKKALVRSIGCTLYGKENRIVMVYVGEKQNTGKSTFIRFLSPFKDNYYTESPLQDNKDSRFQLAENFIYNLEELDSLNGGDISRLKSIISCSVIRERKPYAVQAVSVPRRCNFWGSTNKNDFLTDDSNTRWMCFDVIGINWSYKKEVDIDKVWSQAFALYKDGFDSQLSKEEQDERDVKNKEFETTCIERDLIIQNLEKSDTYFKTNAEVMKLLTDRGSINNLNQYAISRSMAQLGFEKASRKVDGMTKRIWMCSERYEND